MALAHRIAAAFVIAATGVVIAPAFAVGALRRLGVRGLLMRFAPELVIVAVAVAIAVAFAATVLRHTEPMGLPLDDSYIYLTYAKQFGRGEPFTYFPGGGYSAGSTSVLWPMVLAPFWTLGARGHSLVWVSYVACTVFYALSALGVWRIVRRLTGDDLAGVIAGVIALVIAPFAWTSLSGMEVAFASTLLVATILLVIDQPATGPPSVWLAACLAATSLARPEATLIVLGIVGVAVLVRAIRGEWRAVAWWLVPLVPSVAWLTANKVIAGNWFPNTGVAKSYFYLPGFDWTYWLETVWTTTGKLLKGLFWMADSPLVWPKLFAIAWLVGAVRVVRWARRERRYLAGAVIVGAPLVLLLAVVASSGLWNFQNYRYIAPAFPLLAIGIGVALASRPVANLSLIACVGIAAVIAFLPERVVLDVAAAAPFLMLLPFRRARVITLGFVLGWFVHVSRPLLAGDARLFAQGAADTNAQVVKIGRYLDEKLPDASIIFHDAGAIAYYGDGRVFDMLGLVTNHQAPVTLHGPGSRFEFLEALPVEQRPTHFAYYPGWLGTAEFYGDVILQTPYGPRIKGLVKSPFVGDTDMQIIEARFDHVGTGEQPFAHDGWRVVDRIDVAHLASEQAHDWHGTLGRRATPDPTAKWTVVGREIGERGLVLDGGRTIRGDQPSEQFTITVNPEKPTRLVMRTGGAPGYPPWNETIALPVELKLVSDKGVELARTELAPPSGNFYEIAFKIPAGVTRVRTIANAPYRVFHWFVLQP